MDTISRSAALAAGLNKYFTGKPCAKGHVSQRYVQSSACQECIRINTAAHRSPASGETVAQRIAYGTSVESPRARVALREVEAIRAIAEALLVARFPTLANDARVSFRPPLRMTHRAGGTAIVRLPVHRDDAATLRALCDASLVSLSVDNLARANSR